MEKRITREQLDKLKANGKKFRPACLYEMESKTVYVLDLGKPFGKRYLVEDK